jgi:hypothetical protein
MLGDVATRRPWKGRAPIRSSRHSERNYRTLNTMHSFDATESALPEPIPVYVISMAKKFYPERTTQIIMPLEVWRSCNDFNRRDLCIKGVC